MKKYFIEDRIDRKYDPEYSMDLKYYGSDGPIAKAKSKTSECFEKHGHNQGNNLVKCATKAVKKISLKDTMELYGEE